MKETIEKIIGQLTLKAKVFEDIYLTFMYYNLNEISRVIYDIESGYLCKKTTEYFSSLDGGKKGVTSTKVYFFDKSLPNCTEQELTELLNEIEK